MPDGGLVTLGETMGLFTSLEVGPLRHGRYVTVGIGGSESNVSIGVRRLGVHATWFGRVGCDELGDLVERELNAEKVAAWAVRDSEAPTGLMIKERRTTELIRVKYYRAGSAGSRLCSDDLNEDAIRSADVLHVTGITVALGDLPAQAVRAAIEVAHAAHVPVSLDVNYRATLWAADEARACLVDLARQVDIVFAGESEAQLLVGSEGDAVLPLLASLGPSQVVLKRGGRGSSALIEGVRIDRPAVPVTVIDPVGAGDAFVAGYLAETVNGGGPERRLEVANIAGAYAVSACGDWEALPRLEELALLGVGEDVKR